MRVFDQILDRLLDRFRIGRPLLTRVQEQHLLSAHEGLVALLAALAVFPRLCVQVPTTRTRLPLCRDCAQRSASFFHVSTAGQSVSTVRLPSSLRPAQRLVATRKLMTAAPDGINRCSGSAPIQPTSSTRLYGTIDPGRSDRAAGAYRSMIRPYTALRAYWVMATPRSRRTTKHRSHVTSQPRLLVARPLASSRCARTCSASAHSFWCRCSCIM